MRKRAASLLREPIVHFLLAGALLYGVAALHARATDPRRITVTQADIAQLTARYVQQFGALPSAERRADLIDRHIRDEALYRQGVAMGVGQGDEVVRRRVIQKMEFLNERADDVGEPGPDELRRFYQANAARYRSPPRVSFAQIYFSPDHGGDAAARARANAALGRLRAGAEPATVSSDLFPDRQNFTLISPEEAGHIFGRSELARALYELPIGNWVGPVHSGYGWHLIRIEAREASRAPLLAEVEEELRVDWRDARLARLKEERLARLVQSYTVVRDYPAAAPAGKE